ncbi:hypothetical protein [Sphingobacterium multivorum]|uniref:hypothetical protein n=1 Tax=Sphingobacterium multivorum TaxID=28454 RepID=UPI0028ABBB26|nr:hypothetical protein [Sphingobacterium multivorum]
MKENKLSEDFLEDAYRDISNFEVYALKEGYSSQVVLMLVDDVMRVLGDRNQSEYDVVNKIMMYSSSYHELQELLLNKYLYSIITGAYLKEIDRDPKRILYFLSRNSISLRGNSIDKLLQPLKEFARDKVLLDSSSKGKKYEPNFDIMYFDPATLTPPQLRDAKLKDVLNDQGLKKLSVIEDYVSDAVILSKPGTKAKGIIPIFKAMDELKLIDEGYAETFTKPVDLALFISNVTGLTFNKDDVYYWTPGVGKYSQDEFEKHKKALEKLLI